MSSWSPSRRAVEAVEADWGRWSVRPLASPSRPLDTFKSLVGQTFGRVQSLWRSASSSSLSSRSLSTSALGSLRRSSSYTSLSPSLGIPVRERSVRRLVPSVAAYEPKAHQWRRETLAADRHAAFSQTLRERSFRGSAWTPPLHSADGASTPTKRYCQAVDFEKEDVLEAQRPVRPRFYAPTQVSRWSGAALEAAGRSRGLAVARPFLYADYARHRDRTPMRLHFQVTSVAGPMEVRKFAGHLYAHRPLRSLVVY